MTYSLCLSVTCSIVWLFGYELWIVPNLWSDTASIVDAFRPAYTFEKSEGGNVSNKSAECALQKTHHLANC